MVPTVLEAAGNDARPSLTAGLNPIVYRPGLVDLYATDTPSIINTSYRIDGDVVIPSGSAKGVLVSLGGEFGGRSRLSGRGTMGFPSDKTH